MKLEKKLLIYILMLISFFKPVGIAYYSGINSFLQLWKMLSMVALVIMLISGLKSKLSVTKDTSFIYSFIAFEMIYLFNCFFHSTDVGGAFITAISNILLILFIRKKYNHDVHIKCALDFIFSVLIIAHIFSVFYVRTGHIIFEDLGGDYTYLLGTDNYSAFAAIPMIGCIMYFNYGRKNIISKFKTNILPLLLLFTYVYTKSIAAILAMVLLICITYFYLNWNFFSKFLTFKKVGVVCLIILFLIMKFDIQNYFIGFLTGDLLGKGSKGITLNSRTIIWANAWGLILAKPLFGYGELSSEMISNYALYGMGHAHNLILDLLLKTGLIGTFCYMFFWIKPISKIRRMKKDIDVTLLVATSIAYFVLSMLDDYPFMPYIYCVIALLSVVENPIGKGMKKICK